jgi:hypothetical protein
MPSKVKTARLCILVQGWVMAIVAVIFLGVFLLMSVGIGVSGGDGSGAASLFTGIFGLVFTVIMALWAFLFFITAKGITNKKGWAKIMGIILAILGITSVPIGTILGILILIGLFNEEATNWFGSAPSTPVAPAEKK